MARTLELYNSLSMKHKTVLTHDTKLMELTIMSIAERQETDKFLKQWELVAGLFSNRYSELEFQNCFAYTQVTFSEEDGLTISVPTRFIKSRVEEYKSDLLLFWQQVNSDVRKIKIIIGRLKKEKLIEEETLKTAQIIQLPLWSEEKRGTPNSALRGCLFSAIHGNQRKILYRQVICDEPNLKIVFTGKQLDQSDLDVWEMVLHMARQQGLGTDIYFTAKGFLKRLGRQEGHSGVMWLKDSLGRLVACSVEITHNGYTYADNMISFIREEKTQRYKLSIKPIMLKLYQAGWTAIDWEDRQKIGKRPLALWLHGYISSHAKIFPTKVETYYKLSGSENKSMRDFKYNLKKALEYLYELKLIKAFWFAKDLVNIENIPTNLQIKYSQRKKS